MHQQRKWNDKIIQFLHRWCMVKEFELPALIWAFFFFFFLLSTIYMLRPFRDEMAIAAGVKQLQWLFTGTFVATLMIVPIFGLLIKKFPLQKFLPAFFIFFISNLLGFYILFKISFHPVILARTFFIWLGIFNVFVVSLFWSFMMDIFSNEQSRRLFGVISAGGSVGAITGPALATLLVHSFGPVTLLLPAIFLLGLATLCLYRLLNWSNRNSIKYSETAPRSSVNYSHPIGGSIWSGIKAVFRSRYLMGISLFIILYTAISTFIYFERAYMVEQTLNNSTTRTTLFAGIDLTANILAIPAQFFITNRIIQRFGLALMFAIIPFFIILGFISLSVLPVLSLLVGIQILHRVGNYSLLRPGREILFTVTPREDRYKAKNFIDTVIYRGSDALTGWLFAGLISLGLSLSVISLVGLPIAALWMLTGYALGLKQKDRRKQMKSETKLDLLPHTEN